MTKQYSLAIDALRILAIGAVVMIHTTIMSIQAVNHDIATIPFTFILNQLAIFAVPLFFLISGFVLERNYKDLQYFAYFKKRATRIIIPYLFWSVFYYFAYPATIPQSASFFYLLLMGKAAYQLYFIPAIILFYLLFPLLHRYVHWITKKWILIPLLFLEMLFQSYDYFYGPYSFGNALRVTLLSFMMFPFGMIAAHHEQKILTFTKKYFSKLLMLLIGSASIMLAQGWYYYALTHKPQAIYSQYNIFVIPYTLLIATIFFSLFSNMDRYKTIIVRLSKLSFFVFFIHVAIIYTFWKVFKPFFLETQTTVVGAFLFPLVFFIFVIAMSFLLADMIHRIPKISKITG